MIDYLSQLAALTFFLIIGGVLGWLMFPPRKGREEEPVVNLVNGKILRKDSAIERLLADARTFASCNELEHDDLIPYLCETVEQLKHQRDKYKDQVQLLVRQLDEALSKEAAR